MRTIKRKHELLSDIGARRLIYPLDTTFISHLDSTLARKWIEAGWNVENTVFLQLKHLTIPGNQPEETGIPSELFAGLIYAWSKQVYFRIVAISQGFFDNTNDLVLKINAWHERQHLINAEEHIHKQARILTEEDIVKKEVEYVLRTFGKEGFEARRNDVFSDVKRLGNSDAVPGILALLWLREYLGDNYYKYSKNTFPIPSTSYAKSLRLEYREAAMNTLRIYDVLDENPSLLFKHTLEDIISKH